MHFTFDFSDVFMAALCLNSQSIHEAHVVSSPHKRANETA
jgi:phosphohistidine phosphatase SixA